MPLAPDFATVIKRLLQARSESKEQIAAGIGVKRQTLYNWIGGRTEPSRDDAVKAAAYLDVPLGMLWIDAEPISAQERMRLAKLEDGLRRLRVVLDELGLPALTARADRELAELQEHQESEQALGEITPAKPDRVYRVAEREVTELPPPARPSKKRRKGKGGA